MFTQVLYTEKRAKYTHCMYMHNTRSCIIIQYQSSMTGTWNIFKNVLSIRGNVSEKNWMILRRTQFFFNQSNKIWFLTLYTKIYIYLWDVKRYSKVKFRHLSLKWNIIYSFRKNIKYNVTKITYIYYIYMKSQK